MVVWAMGVMAGFGAMRAHGDPVVYPTRQQPYLLHTLESTPAWFDNDVLDELEAGEGRLYWRMGGAPEGFGTTWPIYYGNIPMTTPDYDTHSCATIGAMAVGSKTLTASWNVIMMASASPGSDAAVEIVWCGRRLGSDMTNAYGGNDTWCVPMSYPYSPKMNSLSLTVNAHSRKCYRGFDDVWRFLEPNSTTTEEIMNTGQSINWTADELEVDESHMFKYNNFNGSFWLIEPGVNPWIRSWWSGPWFPSEDPDTVGWSHAFPFQFRSPVNIPGKFLMVTPVTAWKGETHSVQKSTDNGATWSAEIAVDYDDQGQMFQIDPPSSGSAVLYRAEDGTGEPVGMASVSFPANKFVFTSCPFTTYAGGGSMALSQMMPDAPNGTQVYLWNVWGFDFDLAATMVDDQWDSDTSIPTGEAFFVRTTNDWTATFFGYQNSGVMNTWYSGYFNSVGAVAPVSGGTADMLAGYTPIQTGDQVLKWDVEAQDWDEFCDLWSVCDLYDAYYCTWSGNLSFGLCEGLFICPQNTNGYVNVTR